MGGGSSRCTFYVGTSSTVGPSVANSKVWAHAYDKNDNWYTAAASKKELTPNGLQTLDCKRDWCRLVFMEKWDGGSYYIPSAQYSITECDGLR